MNREKLGPAVKSLIEARGENMRSTADSLGLYVNSLRGWIGRNTFPAEVLPKIAAFVDLPGDIELLRKQFDFDVARERRTTLMKLTELERQSIVSMRDALEVITAPASDLLRGPDVRQAETRLLFRGLSSKGLYVCGFLDAFPFELTAAGWASVGEDIVNAVKRGATLVYLVPGWEIAARLEEKGLHPVFSLDGVERPLKTLRDRIKEKVEPSHRRRLSDQVTVAPWDVPAFLTPGMQWLFITDNDESGPIRQLFMQTTLMSQEKSGKVFMPMGDETCSAFLSLLMGQLEKENKQAILKRLMHRD